jgi:trk system potassium uptake protein TrkA
VKRIGIIGAGRFGTALAEDLVRRGAEVILLDSDKDIVQRLAGMLTKAIQGDATNAHVLEETGFEGCDAVVVAIGTDMESSILATMNLKELKVPRIIAKAGTDLHGKVLERVGADQVVYPNRERAQRLARSLLARSPVDYFEIAHGVGIIEISAPPDLVGHSLVESEIRKKYGITVLCIKRPGKDDKTKQIASPSGDEVIEAGDILTVFGPDKKLEALS